MSTGKHPENAINDMERWAAHCTKERQSPVLWNQNWSEVFRPGESFKTEDVIRRLEEKAVMLEQKEDEIAKQKGEVELEYQASPYRVKACKDLKAAYPYQ